MEIKRHVHMPLYSEIRVPVPWGYIAGRWYGDQLARPMVALHGWLDNCGTFAKLAPLLAPYVSLLCLDLPGHGRSSHLPAGVMYNSMENVRVILRVMDSYKWDKISLMGHSMGGSTAFHFAAFFPDRVDILIGLDIIKVMYFNPQISHHFLSYSVEKALVSNDRAVNQSEMNEPPSYTFAQCEQLLYEGSEQSVNLENCKYILERNITKSTKFPDKYYFSRDGRIKEMSELNPSPGISNEMAMRISRIPIPYLVIKGGASVNPSARSTELIDVLQDNNPKFEIYEIPSATHHLHLNNAEPVAKIILEFLRTHRPMEVQSSEPRINKKSSL